MIDRHEVLRTVFPAADGQPYQRMLEVDAELALVELAVIEAAEPEDLPGAVAEAAADAVRPGRAEIPLRAWLFAVRRRTSTCW